MNSLALLLMAIAARHVVGFHAGVGHQNGREMLPVIDGGRSARYRYYAARRTIPHTCSAYAASCIRDTQNQPDGVRACLAAKASCLLTGVHVGPYSGIRYAGMAKR